MGFSKQWKSVFTSIFLVAVLFVIWDVIFTSQGIWGFNSEYHLPYLIGDLPIEEILFFICIPYASIFIHYSLEYFNTMGDPACKRPRARGERDCARDERGTNDGRQHNAI